MENNHRIRSMIDKERTSSNITTGEKRANRLSTEKSPYLLQHAFNPVDWYPWNAEAFSRAKREDRPIFLSIGYSTCHWCHVMEHESFIDETVANTLNDNYIAVKVDREERPDIDDLYMTTCQLMTGRGGWPLTIIMTPDAKPFFAATYIPKESRHGMFGLVDLLTRVNHMWKTDRQRLLASSEKLVDILREHSQSPHAGEKTINVTVFDAAYDYFQSVFDHDNGGFGPAPKFPTPHNLSFLIAHGRKTGDIHSRIMVGRTLEAMRFGGIFDHIGFGFHRYSTDAKWLVPHFEKMLYDQAMLIQAYLDMYGLTNDPFYASVVREIVTYVLRDLTSEEGGFYSAEDADSEGVEGKFYVWTTQEFRDLLSAEQANVVETVFNCRKHGNYRDEASGDETGMNILHLSDRTPTIAAKLNLDVNGLMTMLEEGRDILFTRREKRIHPLKDTKVLTDWNGLMIAALARASRILDEPSWLRAAERAFHFVIDKLTNQQGRLYHRFRENHVLEASFLNDYAFMAWAALELYHSALDPKFLKKASEFADGMLDLFRDSEQGGFFQTTHDGEQLISRQKDSFDGVIPSGNSVAFHVLDELWRLTARREYADETSRLITFFSDAVSRSPQNLTFFLTAFERTFDTAYEIIIVADGSHDETREAIKQLHRLKVPHLMIMLKDIKDPEALSSLAPFCREYNQLLEKPTFYLCSGHACHLPTSDLSLILRQLSLSTKNDQNMT